MVQEMVNEVEVYENETPATEELYSKLELKVRKKFNDEIDRLEKSFRRIMEQLEIQQQNLYQMMKEQIDKEIRSLQEKKKKLKERDNFDRIKKGGSSQLSDQFLRQLTCEQLFYHDNQ